ncbi:hypothetical protein [Demequina litorisediminis]|uniref:Uncharacterized protein n=1 Tax=Demequina litorisediminis TaxID=1849022 RepID=A0ABQ6I879_9MICO|nr:hypothetical protein [Demequina litorisediminis]GMA33950.1 hypothetical protein GCM10025876_01540 [Demequina litorisediminis]
MTWGKAVASLQDVRVRDALIVHWLGATADVVDDVLVGRASEGVHRVMDGALRPGHAATPDAAVLAQAFEWCARALRVTRSRDRAVIHALEAVLAWWSADIRRAATFARDALACDAGYTLAILVAEMCAVGLGPGWQRGVDMP